jgi:hypothetical protein
LASRCRCLLRFLWIGGDRWGDELGEGLLEHRRDLGFIGHSLGIEWWDLGREEGLELLDEGLSLLGRLLGLSGAGDSFMGDWLDSGVDELGESVDPYPGVGEGLDVRVVGIEGLDFTSRFIGHLPLPGEEIDALSEAGRG